jgi:hypothetical protein
MTSSETEDAPTSEADEVAHEDGRLWLAVLAVAAVGSIPLLLRDGRRQWFFLDEWSFLVNRSLSKPSSLFEAHNGHWVTVPVIVYRVLFRIWGLNTYRPYQLAAMLVHLAVVLLIWAVMRRLGVRPWIATACSAVFILFGSGAGNILYGFQITLTGSIACGFAHLLGVDHDGPVDRRDGVGLAFGFLGLMCSGVGVAMVAMVGVAALIRRGWRVALMHVGAPALAYVVWFVGFPSDTPRSYSFTSQTLRFVEEMGRVAFVGLGQNRLVGVALGGLAIVGIGWSVRRAQREPTLQPLALPLALVIGFLAFALVTGVARVDVGGVASAASGRYVYVASALLLPLIALGVEAFARRQAALAIAALVVLAVGVPGNVRLLAKQDPFTRGSPDYIEAAAHSPLLKQLPADMRLRLTEFAPDLAPTASWLLAASAAGRVPRPHDPSPQLTLTTDLQLGLWPAHAVTPRVCPAGALQRRMRVERGDHIRFSGTIVVFAVDGTARSMGLRFAATSNGRLDALAGPLDIVVTGLLGKPPRLC